MSDGQPPVTDGQATDQPAEESLQSEETPPQAAENTVSTLNESTSQLTENTMAPGDGTPTPTEMSSTPGEQTPTSEENTPKPAKKISKSAQKTPVVGQAVFGEPTLSPDSPFWAPLNAGWIREIVYRGSVGPNQKRADAYYKSPVGKKYRSLKEIERAMFEGKPGFDGLDVQNFTYNQLPLGVNDSTKEVIRGADPTRQFPSVKRPSEPGQTEGSAVKKPRKSAPVKPVHKTPVAAPPKTKMVTAPPKSRIVVAPVRPYPQTAVRTPIRPYPQTAVRTPFRNYQQVTVVGARTMGIGSGIRPVPTNLLMNPVRTMQKVQTKFFPAPKFAGPPSPQKSSEEIVCEPAIYGIGKSPEKPTTSTQLQTVQKTTTPTPARIYQIVSSKRLTVPFTVPPQDLALDGIATIAPSEDNTYVEGKTLDLSESSSSDTEKSDPEHTESSTQQNPSVVSKVDSSEAPQKRLDIAKLRKFLASKQKKITSKAPSASEDKGPSDTGQNTSDLKPKDTELDKPCNNSNSLSKLDDRTTVSEGSDSESKPKHPRENHGNSDADLREPNAKLRTSPNKLDTDKCSEKSDTDRKDNSPENLKSGCDESDIEFKTENLQKNRVNSSDSDNSDSKSKTSTQKRKTDVRSDDSDFKPSSSSHSNQFSDFDQSGSNLKHRYKKPSKLGKGRRSSKAITPRKKRRKPVYSESDSESDYERVSPKNSKNVSGSQSGSDSRSKTSSKVRNASDSGKSVDSKNSDEKPESSNSDHNNSDSRKTPSERPKLHKNLTRKFVSDSDSLDSRLTKPNVRKRKISSVYSSTSDQSGSDLEQKKAKTRKRSGGSKISSSNRADRESANPSPITSEHSNSNPSPSNNSLNVSKTPEKRPGNETNEHEQVPESIQFQQQSSSSSSISSSDSESG